MKMRACEIFFPRIFFFCAHLLCVCFQLAAASSIAVDIDTCKQQWAPIEVWPIWPTATTKFILFLLLYPQSLCQSYLKTSFSTLSRLHFFHWSTFPLLFWKVHSPPFTTCHLPITDHWAVALTLPDAWCSMIPPSLSSSSFSLYILN